MRPAITGFVTREMAGLRRPRSVSRVIRAVGRVTGHYGGPPVQYTTHPDPSRCGCRTVWKNWQEYHMRPGWSGTKDGAADIAYTGGVCQAGHALAGRGAGVKSAGTGPANGVRYAVVFLLGAGQRPTPEAYAAFAWWCVQLREADGVNPYGNQTQDVHSDHMSTACPGDYVRGEIKAGRLQPTVAAPPLPPPPPQEDKMYYFAVHKGATWYGDTVTRRQIGTMDEVRDIMARLNVAKAPWYNVGDVERIEWLGANLDGAVREDIERDAARDAELARLVASQGAPDPKVFGQAAAEAFSSALVGRPELLEQLRDAGTVSQVRESLVRAGEALAAIGSS